mgnify:CR=1 FL=1
MMVEPMVEQMENYWAVLTEQRLVDHSDTPLENSLAVCLVVH